MDCPQLQCNPVQQVDPRNPSLPIPYLLDDMASPLRHDSNADPSKDYYDVGRPESCQDDRQGLPTSHRPDRRLLQSELDLR